MEKFSDSNFDAGVSSGVVVIDFYADWCRPCTLLKPVFNKVAESLNTAKFATVDIENSPTITAKLQISSLPTIIIFKDGQPVKKLSGLVSEQQLIDAVNAV